MTWRIKDEWVETDKSRHVVVFHNPDTKGEHHLVHEFGVLSCPHCGHIKSTDIADFAQIKADELKKLNDHHRKVAAYLEKHVNVRRGDGPKQ